MSLEQQLLDLKAKGEKLNSLKIENQVKLQSLEQEKLKLLEECNQLGLDPANIEQTLKNEEATLQKEMAELSTKIQGILDEISRI
jgi:hypothetical protein